MTFTSFPIPTNSFTSFAFPATGGTANRNTPDRVADFINVKEFGAVGDGVTDATAAFTSWINFLMGGSTPRSGYIPSGTYLISSPLPLITAPIGIYGAGPFKTWLLVSTSMTGDLFSVSECWFKANYNGNSVVFPQSAGVLFSGFSVAGTRGVNTQNVFVFYDRNDCVRMDDVSVFFMNGRGLYFGVTKSVSIAYVRESRFSNLRFFNCGGTNLPVIEFNSQGGGDATNEIDVNSVDIFAPWGVGLVIRSNGTSIRDMKFFQLRIEGLLGSTTTDLLRVGDPVLTGNINNIYFQQCELLNPQSGFCAFRTTASSGSTKPFEIHYHGQVAGGAPPGKGIIIDYGRDLRLDITHMNTTDTNLTVAATTQTGTNIIIDADGQESIWTTSIDASAAANVLAITRHQFP